MPLTICLLNWKRPENLRRIIDRLAEQTLRPQVFLWNNAAEPFDHPAVTWRVESSRNVACPPRWWMASFAETPLVASLDDDLLPADRRVVEDAVRLAEREPHDRAIGPAGAVLVRGRPYAAHRHVFCPPDDVRVDVVKGRCLIVRTAALRRLLRLGDLAGPLGREDDVAVCGALAAGRPRHHLVPGAFHRRFENLPEAGEALSLLPGHAQRRQRARQRWNL
jgi:hypothetical protein